MALFGSKTTNWHFLLRSGATLIFLRWAEGIDEKRGVCLLDLEDNNASSILKSK